MTYYKPGSPERIRQAISKYPFCPLCGTRNSIEFFRDHESKAEFTISGICQQCQDRIFVEDPPDDR